MMICDGASVAPSPVVSGTEVPRLTKTFAPNAAMQAAVKDVDTPDIFIAPS